MEIIEQIGAYAGLASVLGLAVLAALYFSQARDVKRLREWAGRAPERGGVPGGAPAPGQRVHAQPRPPAPHRVPSPAAAAAQGPARPGSAPAAPGARPPGAPAPVRAAAPAATGPATATPAAARVAEAEDRALEVEERHEGLSQDTVVHPPPTPPEEDERAAEPPADDPDLDDPDLDADADDLEEEPPPEDGEPYAEDDGYDAFGRVPAPGQGAATRPSRPPAPMPTRVGSGAPRGPILPPYERSRPGGGGNERWYRRGLGSRGGALVAGVSLFLVALLAVALVQLGGDGGAEPQRQQAAPSGGGDGGAARSGGSGVVPGRVTVSVLNGTTTGGLARDVGDKLQRQGFRLGNVTNSTDQQRAESVVLFAPGAEREAAEVGRRVKIDQREPIDPESQTLAGDASVVVITGGDLVR